MKYLPHAVAAVFIGIAIWAVLGVATADPLPTSKLTDWGIAKDSPIRR